MSIARKLREKCGVGGCEAKGERKLSGSKPGVLFCFKNVVYCDDCDGTGWVEGGKTLQTTCSGCKGSGVLHA